MSIEDLNSLDQFKLGVAAGLYDSDLNTIVSVVRARQELLRVSEEANMRASIKVGSRIEFTDYASPKYLKGARATVESIGHDGKIHAVLDRPVGKFRGQIVPHPQTIKVIG